MNQFKKIENKLVGEQPRTKFPFQKKHYTSLDAGRVVPLACLEVLPGDLWQLDLCALTQMQTPIAPIMSDIYQDYYFFFVPNRLLDENFEDVITISDFSGFKTGKLSTFDVSANFKVKPGSIANYMGLPIGVYDVKYHEKLTKAPFKGYLDIWNYYFRDENYQSEKSIVDVNGSGSSLNDNWLVPESDVIDICGQPAPANEYHNLFTSILPSPQKGPSITLPFADQAPLVGNASVYFASASGTDINFGDTSSTELRWPKNGNEPSTSGPSRTYNLNVGDISGGYGSEVYAAVNLKAPNAYADLTSATATTINQFRESVVMQHFLETLARTGSRYGEYIKGFFGVEIADARIQKPEFIAEWHNSINISTIVQQSGQNSEDGTFLGTTGAVSRTGTTSNRLVTFAAPEFGYLYCVTVIRHTQSYPQGIENMFFRTKGTDFYNPTWQRIGEVGIKKRNILAPVGFDNEFMKTDFQTAGSDIDLDDDIGFNEAFAEYKYFYDQVSGILNPVAKDGMDFFTLGRTFTTSDINANDVIVSKKTSLDRALAIQNQPQFLMSFMLHGSVVRRMKKYSTPGLTRI